MTVWEKLWPTPSPGFDLPIRLVDTDVTFGGPRANGTEAQFRSWFKRLVKSSKGRSLADSGPLQGINNQRDTRDRANGLGSA